MIQFRDAPYVHSGQKDLVCQWFPTDFKLIADDVCLIDNYWEDEWKNPTEQTGHQNRKKNKTRMKKN
jgi:hypothetical protein